jgi:hypothetical protein
VYVQQTRDISAPAKCRFELRKQLVDMSFGQLLNGYVAERIDHGLRVMAIARHGRRL